MTYAVQKTLVERSTPMTDAELAAHYERLVTGEQAAVDRMIAGGARFVRSGLGRIHTVECGHSGFNPSRRAAYEALAHGAPLRSPTC